MKNSTTSVGLNWTGERYVPGVQGDIELEHLHRYFVAQPLAVNRRVLDIACGEGYGSQILAEVAASVIGIDISIECVSHARNTYVRSNLAFDIGSCNEIPLPNASIDLIVSFETIEHHDRHVEMLSEFRRVLAPNGVVVISSPDTLHYSTEPNHSNPFHVKELSRQEFETLLQQSFRNLDLYGQRVQYGSAIAPLGQLATSYANFQKHGRKVTKGTGLADPVYLIAVASDAALPLLSAGTFRADPPQYFAISAKLESALAERNAKVDALADELARRGDSFRELQAQFDSTVANLQEEQQRRSQIENKLEDLQRSLVVRDLTVSALTRNLEASQHLVLNTSNRLQEARERLLESNRQVVSVDAECVRRGTWALGLQTQLDAAQLTINDLRTSTSWRITYPLRATKRLLGLAPPLPEAARASSPAWRAARWLYHKAPIAAYPRERLKNALFARFPNMFSHLPSFRLWQARRNLGGYPIKPTVSNTVGTEGGSMKRVRDPAPPLPSLLASGSPEVSVVIPVYGHLELTLKCLQSIALHPPACPFEIVVVDDCSQDSTPELLKEIRGIRVVTNIENQGFIRSCNRGASVARGRYLCFLNNDTEVCAGWLDELIATYALFPSAGLVGSKLLYPNGTLQEAGGVLWSDGSAWNYGRGKDPRSPEFSYAREVDYCSGASLVIRKDLFLEMGGFDEHFLPAYGEDSDLALKIRSRGRSVIFQPLSVVVHHEGATAGTDTTTGPKAYQLENARKLAVRWKDLLSTYQPPGEALDRAKDRNYRFRILVLDHCTPTPDRDAGSITTLNLMLLFRHAGFQVTFIPEDNFLFLPHYTETLQRLGIEALYAPFTTSVDQHVKVFGKRYDVVLMFRPAVAARHSKQIRAWCPNAKVLYHTSDVHFLRMSREADLTGDPATRRAADGMRALELGILREADSVIVHSTAERELIAAAVPCARLVVFPWAIPIRGSRFGFGSRADIAFVGGYQHPPNIDAAKFFINDIFPLIRRSLPGVRFYVVGSNPPSDLRAMATEDVIVTDFVEDLAGFLDRMRVAVAPLRYGAGIKGKLATTLSLGLPSVATTLAIEGMNLSPGKEIVVADTPIDFANATVSLYQSEEQWMHLSERGIRYASTTFGDDAAVDSMRRILTSLGFPAEHLCTNFTLVAPSGELILERMPVAYPGEQLLPDAQSSALP